jgi:hypothetical protein
MGPPGTGKTRTLIGAANLIHLNAYNAHYDDLCRLDEAVGARLLPAATCVVVGLCYECVQAPGPLPSVAPADASTSDTSRESFAASGSEPPRNSLAALLKLTRLPLPGERRQNCRDVGSESKWRGIAGWSCCMR